MISRTQYYDTFVKLVTRFPDNCWKPTIVTCIVESGLRDWFSRQWSDPPPAVRPHGRMINYISPLDLAGGENDALISIKLERDTLQYLMQSNAFITRCKIVRYYINNCRNCGRISIRCWTHQRHPIPCPRGRAIGCLLWIFVGKLNALQRHATAVGLFDIQQMSVNQW